jgi:3-oxoacyl-[acyl-carrier-protein] synthase-3
MRAYGKILAISTAVPGNIVENSDWEDTIIPAEKTSKITGVKTRRWEQTVQGPGRLAVASAQDVLDKMQFEPALVDVLVVVTQTGNRRMPGVAFDVHKNLGLRGDCAILEINWACSGYVHGLWAIMKILSPGQIGLLVVGDTISQITDAFDVGTVTLFGDAVSSTLVEGHRKGGLHDHSNEHDFVLRSDGSGAEYLKCDHDGSIHMDGPAVFSFSSTKVIELIHYTLGLDSDPPMTTPDRILFHQANKYMLDRIVKKLNLYERFPGVEIPSNIEEFGNCSSASIPLLICSKWDYLPRGLTAMFGFGAGWSWGAALIYVHDTVPCNLVVLDT